MHFFGSLRPSPANERASKLSHRPSESPQAITLLVSVANLNVRRRRSTPSCVQSPFSELSEKSKFINTSAYPDGARVDPGHTPSRASGEQGTLPRSRTPDPKHKQDARYGLVDATTRCWLRMANNDGSRMATKIHESNSTETSCHIFTKNKSKSHDRMFRTTPEQQR